MRNQFGFFTLEIILVVMIISLLATVAVPNMHKMLDAARLDYEIKKFCSELDFAHSLGKQSSVNTEIFSNTFFADDDSRRIAISIDEQNRAYQLLRASNSGYNPIREKHFLSDGIKINSSLSEKTLYLTAPGTTPQVKRKTISSESPPENFSLTPDASLTDKTFA